LLVGHVTLQARVSSNFANIVEEKGFIIVRGLDKDSLKEYEFNIWME